MRRIDLMVLPLLLAAGARLAAGAAVRGVATRAVTSVAAKEAVGSVGGRLASNAVGSYGVNAIQRAHQNRQMAGSNPQQPQQDHGATLWARQNPNEFTVAATAGAVRRLSGTGMGDGAAAQATSILQSTQFH